MATDPRLDDQGSLVVETVYGLFRERSTWPTFAALDRRLDREHSVDAQAALDALPRALFRSSLGGARLREDEEVVLTLAGIAASHDAGPDLDRFWRCFRYLVQRERDHDPDHTGTPLVVTSDEAHAELGLDLTTPDGLADARRLRKLLSLAPPVWSLATGNDDAATWQLTITREIRTYRDLADVGELVARVEAHWSAADESFGRLPTTPTYPAPVVVPSAVSGTAAAAREGGPIRPGDREGAVGRGASGEGAHPGAHERPFTDRPDARIYWARRQGHAPDLTGAQTARLFASLLSSLAERGYLQEWFGYDCVDVHDRVPGLAGRDPAAYVLRKTFRDGLWPVEEVWAAWDDDDLFTAVEFYHDHVSRPEETSNAFHDYQRCGWHYTVFDRRAGAEEYRVEVNDLLRHVGDGFELGASGQIVRRNPIGLDPLTEAPLVAIAGIAYEPLVSSAIRKFRARGSSADDRRDAVRDLADALELLRPQLAKVLSSKDDDILFDLANNFGIRHMNARQRLEYDRAVWHSWMFYFYLATIQAATQLLAKQADAAEPPTET